MSVTRRRDDAEDLAQTAIVRAFQAPATFRGDTAFEAWLCRIALNAAHDYQRSAWRRRVLLWGQNRPDDAVSSDGLDIGTATGKVDASNSAHIEAEHRELQRRVRGAVAALGPNERVPIWLIYFEEFTIAEVSRLESVPESTVRSRVKVGLRKLERTLGDLELPSGKSTAEASMADIQPPRPSAMSSRARVSEMKGSTT